MADEGVINRLKTYIECDCTTATAFASGAGVDASNFNKMLSGKLPITKRTLKKFADAYGINMRWLEYGDGDMLLPQEPKSLPSEDETRPRIPMTVAAGTLTGFADSCYLKDCQRVPLVKALPDYDYTMIVKGDSMEPKFEGGDEIAIRKVNDIIEWGKTYVLDTRDGAVVKRLYDAGEAYRCVSYNAEYPDFTVKKEDVFGVYKVVGLIRI